MTNDATRKQHGFGVRYTNYITYLNSQNFCFLF